MAETPDKVIKKKVDAFINGMNRELEAMAKELSYKTGAGKECKVVPLFKLDHDNNKATYARTPEQQVEFLLSNKSWTFTSRHMNDAARHVLVKVDGKVNWAVDTAKGWEPYDFEEVKKRWVAQMKKQGLQNFDRKQAWGDDDVLHLELPNHEPSLNDSKVQKVIELYMTATRKEGKKRNEKLERNFKSVIEKYEKQMHLPAAKITPRDGRYYKFDRGNKGSEIGKELSAKAAQKRLLDKQDIYTPRKSDAKQLAKNVHKGKAEPNEAHKPGFYPHFHPAGDHQQYGHAFFGQP